MEFVSLLNERKVLLLDGAMGTELERHGASTSGSAWSARAIYEQPKLIEEIHKDYIISGADIITANTFRTNPRALHNAGMPDRSKELTRRAVKITRNAIDKYAKKDILLAGSVAPVEDCYSPDLVPDDDTLYREHFEFIACLAECGVDVILLETMNTLREAKAALNAAKRSCALPVLVSVVCSDANYVFSGESLEDIALELAGLHADALLVNCSEPTITTNAIQTLAMVCASRKILFGGYANAGTPQKDGVIDATTLATPEEFCSEARKWLTVGATIVGGCCGTTPAHIVSLRSMIDETLGKN